MENIRTHYNNCHSATQCVVVEHTFGILKGRWIILKFINVNSVEKAVKIIAACCILHNFCYINLDYWDNLENNLYEDIEVNNDVNNADSNEKRNAIAYDLFRRL